MFTSVREEIAGELAELRSSGLYKEERLITSPQGATITVAGREVLNFCANNYLGLADDPRILDAASAALQRYGFGMASVRFICGTQTIHTELEERLSEFLRTEATILFSSCFDANGGIFQTLLGEDDVVISDQLNHASIIDGIRLCHAQRLQYANRDLEDLQRQLHTATQARRRLIVTDGVFSMDGSMAPLDGICELADRYGAMVMVDDSHAVGVVGASGRGTPEHFGVEGRVDILTGTLGKALGGATGGYLSARSEIVALSRQRARPYLFSNSVAPPIVAAGLAALQLLEGSSDLREQLFHNAASFRSQIVAAGFDVLPGEHPIVPVMIGDAARATAMADRLLEHGIYVIGFSYPVVPLGAARIRVQLSAAHTSDDVDRAVAAFAAVRDELG
jgi:glycine C-acetyltransferase